MALKKTCNRSDAARMGKLHNEGYSVKEIAAATRVIPAVVERVLASGNVPAAKMGAGSGGVASEETPLAPADKRTLNTPPAAPVAPPAVPAPAAAAPAPAPVAPPVDNRSPQQKAADTRAANKAAAAAVNPAPVGEGAPAGDPSFTE